MEPTAEPCAASCPPPVGEVPPGEGFAPDEASASFLEHERAFLLLASVRLTVLPPGACPFPSAPEAARGGGAPSARRRGR